MPYLFVHDGSPSAQDDRTNFLWYESSDPRSLAAALELASQHLAARRAPPPVSFPYPVPVARYRPLSHAR